MKIASIILFLIAISFIFIPVTAWLPNTYQVYMDDGFTLQVSKANYDSYCAEKSSTGYTTLAFRWRRMPANGSSSNICNAAGDCNIDPVTNPARGSRNSSMMHYDNESLLFYFYAITPYCNAGNDYSDVLEFYNVTAGAAPKVNVTFMISDANTFLPLPNVSVLVYGIAADTTNATGGAKLVITPPSPRYTYTLTRTGYQTIVDEPLGLYGQNGGTLYKSMIPVLPGSKLVNLVAMDAVSGSFISGFAAKIEDTLIHVWTNGTYPSGVDSFWTNQSTPLTANITATGYQQGLFSKTTRADDWEEDWLVSLYRSGDLPANTSWSKLRISFVDVDMGGIPASNVLAVSGYDGAYTISPGSGIVVFDVPNITVATVTASKSGYQTISQNFPVSSAFSDWTMEISKQIQATPSPMPTWDNGAPKYDANGNLLDRNGNIIGGPKVTPKLTGGALEQYNQGQAQDAIQLLYDNGAGIVALCILVIIMRLINMI